MMFDITIINLEAVSYLHMTPKKALTKVEKDKQYLHLQACLEGRRSFSPVVYSEGRTPGEESLDVNKRIDTLLSIKLKQ